MQQPAPGCGARILACRVAIPGDMSAGTPDPSPHFSPRGEAKCVGGPSVQGARRSVSSFLNNAGVLEPYVQHGEQAQRSNGGPIACFGRQVVRNAAR